MTTIETIVDLQAAYDELNAAETLLGGIPDWMRELHEEYSTRRGEIEAVESAIAESASARREAEAGVADSQEKLKLYQEQIGRVRNQREYSALLQELDLIKQQIQRFEEAAIEAMETQESEQTRLEEARQAFSELEQRYNEELAKWEGQKPEVAEKAEKLRSRIEALEERLPPPILEQFNVIRGRFDGAALAEVRELQRVGKGAQMWHCSGCNYRVLPQAVVEIRTSGNVVLCDSCKRILYWIEEAS